MTSNKHEGKIFLIRKIQQRNPNNRKSLKWEIQNDGYITAELPKNSNVQYEIRKEQFNTKRRKWNNSLPGPSVDALGNYLL